MEATYTCLKVLYCTIYYIGQITLLNIKYYVLNIRIILYMIECYKLGTFMYLTPVVMISTKESQLLPIYEKVKSPPKILYQLILVVQRVA